MTRTDDDLSFPQLDTFLTPANAAYAWEQLDRIKADPSIWEQGSWICGTQACYGGHIALGRGWVPVNFVGPRPQQFTATVVKVGISGEYPVDWAVAYELGISYQQSSQLCYGRNTIADLEWFLNDWAGPRA